MGVSSSPSSIAPVIYGQEIMLVSYDVLCWPELSRAEGCSAYIIAYECLLSCSTITEMPNSKQHGVTLMSYKNYPVKKLFPPLA